MSEQTEDNGKRPHGEEGVPASAFGEDLDRAVADRSGQYVTEGDDVRIDRPAGDAGMKAATDRVALSRQDAGTINAVHLSMDRSGADTIDTQRLSMTNSGAKSLSTQSAQLDKSGVLLLKADRAVFQDSSSMVTQSREARFSRSRVGLSQSGTSVIEPGTKVGMLQAGTVTAGGDVRTGFLMSGSVTAEGDIHTTFDGRSAAALGGGFAVVWLVLRRILSR